MEYIYEIVLVFIGEQFISYVHFLVSRVCL